MTTAPETRTVLFRNAPRLGDVVYESPGVPFDDWRLAAYDPTWLRYSDESDQALDETNYNVILHELSIDDLPFLDVNRPYGMSDDTWNFVVKSTYAKAIEVGAALITVNVKGFHSLLCCLIVAPTEENIDWLTELERSIDDYLLLDEQAYDEREYAAWEEYLPRAWRDEINEASKHLDDTPEIEAMIDHLTATDELAWLAASNLHHYNGFSGEYGPSLLRALALATPNDVILSLLGDHAETFFSIYWPTNGRWV
jgi:hypothetical protein